MWYSTANSNLNRKTLQTCQDYERIDEIHSLSPSVVSPDTVQSAPKIQGCLEWFVLPRRNPENRGFPLGLMEVINPPNITTEYEKTLGNGLVEGQSSDWDDRFDPIGLSTGFFWNMLGWWMENPTYFYLQIDDFWLARRDDQRDPEATPAGFRKTPPVLYSCNGLASRDWTRHSLLANNALIINITMQVAGLMHQHHL